MGATVVGEPGRESRDELLARAMRALQTLWVGPSPDPAPALMADLARLVADDPTDEQVRAVLGHLYWHRYERHGAQSDLDDAVRMLAPHFFPDRMFLIPDGLRTEIADAYSTHVDTRLAQVLTGEGDIGENLSELAAWCWFLLEHADPDNDQYGVHLGGLGTVLYTRYDVLGDVNALLQAIGLLSRAARVTSAGHPSGPGIRGNLAIALARRHGLTGSANDLRTAFEACVLALREPLTTADRDGLMGMFASLLRDRVLRARAEHRWDDVLAAGRAVLGFPELRSYALEAVAEGLEERFTTGSDVADLDEAIRQWTALECEVPETYTVHERAYVTMRRANAYWLRYRHDHRLDDLDVVVDAHEQALAVIPDDDITLRWELLRKLAIALLERIERQPTAYDVERAVTVIRAGLADREGQQASPHLRAVLTRALPRALWSRYILARRPEDLDEAAELLGSAAVREVSSADGVLLFGGLAAQVHRARYRAGQGLDALQEAVAACRRALGAAPDVHPARPGVLVQLGMSMFYLYQHTGDLAALDEAVDRDREAVRGVGEELHGPVGVDALYYLGTALAERGARTGSLDDLNDAVRTLRRLHATAAAIRTRELHGLGFALKQLFDRTRDFTQLDEAVDLLRRAVESCEPDESEAPIVLSGLSSALLCRYGHSGGPADLDEALVYARRAADAVPANDPVALLTLTSLTGALLEERRRSPERVDVDDLVALCRRVIDLAPPDHAALGVFHHNLGIARKERSEATEPDPMFRVFSELTGGTVIPFGIVEAVTDLQKAATSETLAASHRIRSAQAAALTLYPVEVLAALELLEYAIELIPLAAPRRIARADQQHAVKDHSALVTFTAAAALSAGEQRRPDLPHLPLLPYAARSALQSLEQGRTVLLSQMLDTRGDISDLRRSHSGLADRFVHLRNLLDSEDDGALDRPRAATELTATIEEIRGLEGYASFARPPEPEALFAAAEAGPIVVFNCDETRCDALLVTSGGVRHLPLPGLTHAELTSQADLFHHTLAVVADPETDWRAQREAQRTLSGILGWLWDVAAEPALLALGIGPGSGRGSEPPRVWWSPGGLLGSLPLHAAGHHAESAGGGDRTVLDRVVSSYTPTIRALRHARRPQPAGGGPGRSLIVAMPATPGAPPLSGALEEAAAVAAVLPDPNVVTGTATREAVLAGLIDARVIHLACHAVTDAVDPSRSRLLLWDHETKALNVAGVASVTLERAELAYLSACRTTYTAAPDLLDEAIHLTSAFQLAGFRHVVGTLWEVDDVISATVAKGFYASLSDAEGLHCARSAAALRTSVLALRDEFPGTPSLWAGYLHAGA
ncbi:CHAT domain-containing protein [Streptomyces collinus]|uniref:CHAT domain-containing protein n=1 Tax=Streptomyces collinus TaxID=42684 RepID=UPI0036629EC7